MNTARVEPAFTLVQLTDTHLRAEGELVHGSVDTYANLTRVLDQLMASGQRVDAMVFSGDVADDGDPVDVLVAARTPVVPGAVVRARPVACY